MLQPLPTQLSPRVQGGPSRHQLATHQGCRDWSPHSRGSAEPAAPLPVPGSIDSGGCTNNCVGACARSARCCTTNFEPLSNRPMATSQLATIRPPTLSQDLSNQRSNA